MTTVYSQKFVGVDRGIRTEVCQSLRYGRLEHAWGGNRHEIRDEFGRALLVGTREQCIEYLHQHGGRAAAHAV